jgi:Chaperone of endosialidase
MEPYFMKTLSTFTPRNALPAVCQAIVPQNTRTCVVRSFLHGSQFGLIAIALACLAVASTVLAVSPAPDGGYAGNNTAEGDSTLVVLDTNSGFDNTAVGFGALNSTTTGDSNTAIGSQALVYNVTGNANTAVGFFALNRNTAGGNTAVGSDALHENTSGTGNAALGLSALYYNTTGAANTATGVDALGNNRSGNNNVATGHFALFTNTTGYNNTATGFQALYSNIGDTAFNNTATGSSALHSNTSGNTNTADGAAALFNNKTGNTNTAEGAFALSNNTSGSSNIALGYSAGANLTTGSNNIDIGNKGVLGESAKIRIGTKGTHNGTFIAGISGVAVSGAQVVVNSSGKLGVAGSSARFKEQIKPMDKTSEAVLALTPVTFRYKEEIDENATPQFGLIAEEVEKVNPDLVIHDEEGKPYTVRYDAVNAMLLNEFLKEHRKVQEQDSRLEKQEVFIGRQQKQIQALTAGLQKVTAKVERHKRLVRTADNDQ